MRVHEVYKNIKIVESQQKKPHKIEVRPYQREISSCITVEP